MAKEPELPIEYRKLKLEQDKFDYQKWQDGRSRNVSTWIAFLAIIVTAGQLIIATLTYKATTARNEADGRKTAADIQKATDDIDKNHDEETREVVKLILENGDKLFHSRKDRDLVQSIILKFRGPFADTLKAALLNNTLDPQEHQERQEEIRSAKLELPKSVYIHYGRGEDKTKLVKVVAQLQTRGFVSYAEPEKAQERGIQTNFMYFKKNTRAEAEEVRDLVATLIGINREALPVELNKAPTDNPRNVYAVWMKALP